MILAVMNDAEHVGGCSQAAYRQSSLLRACEPAMGIKLLSLLEMNVSYTRCVGAELF